MDVMDIDEEKDDFNIVKNTEEMFRLIPQFDII